ncbi:hypothetical protein SLS62_005067 [Diatrype stigma]|uniref:Uncharacterized protein n=1 Tax=Diatrype stigma TaxID=117547 RepID=A0AAN9US63_9PEZI
MPRPFDHELRSHFEPTDVPRKSRCRHCASEILNHAGSLKRHLNEFCKEYSNSISSSGGVGGDGYTNGASSSRRSAEVPRYGGGAYGYVGTPSSSSAAAAGGAGGSSGPNDPRLLLPPGMDIDGPGEGPQQQQQHSQSPRKAQQQVRKQTAARVRTLEHQVLGLQGEVQRLRRENEILRGRQAHVQHVVSSWTDFTGPAMFGSFAAGGGSGGGGGIEIGTGLGSGSGSGRNARVPAWRGPPDHRPVTGNADAPGDTDNERQTAGDGGGGGGGCDGDDGGATGSRNSPLFTP